MKNSKHDTLLFIARLIIGGLFIYTGWLKVSDINMTVGFFSTLGIPAFMAYVVGYCELLGGIAVVFGIYLEKATIILSIIMIVAIYLTRNGGLALFGLPLVTLAGLLSIMASGAGRYAVKMKGK